MPQWAKKTKLYNEKNGRFMWGLIYRVIRILKKYQELDNNFTFEYPAIIFDYKIDNFYDKELRDYQKEAVETFLHYKMGIIQLPCGSGKTRIAKEIIKQLNARTLVIVHTKELLKQWQKDDLYDIYTYQKFVRMVENDEIQKNYYNLIIADECHLCKCKSIKNIFNNINFKYALGLCLHPKTLITIEGNKKQVLRKINIGDAVLSYNENNKSFEYKKIINKFEKNIDDYYYEISVKIAGYNRRKTIRCSKEHKFLTDIGWKSAEELNENDEIYTLNELTYDVWNKNKKGLQEGYLKGHTLESYFGKEKSNIIKNKIRNKLIGRIVPKEQIEKTLQTKIKNNSILIGEKNPMFTTGISYMNKKLKLKINNCEKCNKILNNDRNKHIHHIDKNRNNNNKDNLKVLCNKCHSIEHYYVNNVVRCELCSCVFDNINVKSKHYYHIDRNNKNNKNDNLLSICVKCYEEDRNGINKIKNS